ncbi:hypothetical protein [Sphingomonas sp.]|uniref:hypothetical protein n=1 Tax=Sphingomonas sp. TaxID=28214 RepID=UPI002DD6780C|nr:hypothetical protein [Sphingomonas sp.]
MGIKQPDIGPRRHARLVLFIGPALGVASSQVLAQFLPPLSGGMRQTITVIASILIATLLTWIIYRFART